MVEKHFMSLLAYRSAGCDLKGEILFFNFKKCQADRLRHLFWTHGREHGTHKEEDVRGTLGPDQRLEVLGLRLELKMSGGIKCEQRSELFSHAGQVQVHEWVWKNGPIVGHASAETDVHWAAGGLLLTNLGGKFQLMIAKHGTNLDSLKDGRASLGRAQLGFRNSGAKNRQQEEKKEKR